MTITLYAFILVCFLVPLAPKQHKLCPPLFQNTNSNFENTNSSSENTNSSFENTNSSFQNTNSSFQIGKSSTHPTFNQLCDLLAISYVASTSNVFTIKPSQFPNNELVPYLTRVVLTHVFA